MYDVFIWTRFDELYLCEHFDLDNLQIHRNTLYLPAGERWGGWSDRHIVATGPAFLKATSISNELVCSPRVVEVFSKSKCFIPT